MSGSGGGLRVSGRPSALAVEPAALLRRGRRPPLGHRHGRGAGAGQIHPAHLHRSRGRREGALPGSRRRRKARLPVCRLLPRPLLPQPLLVGRMLLRRGVLVCLRRWSLLLLRLLRRGLLPRPRPEGRLLGGELGLLGWQRRMRSGVPGRGMGRRPGAVAAVARCVLTHRARRRIARQWRRSGGLRRLSRRPTRRLCRRLSRRLRRRHRRRPGLRRAWAAGVTEPGIDGMPPPPVVDHRHGTARDLLVERAQLGHLVRGGARPAPVSHWESPPPARRSTGARAPGRGSGRAAAGPPARMRPAPPAAPGRARPGPRATRRDWRSPGR